mmetsp:Transcript_18723/g.27341  ORF Transcript_18723/g.27341 Transcript_18723/m.27341 type:complete len:111 (+) Transcript_18723:1-333(+)
MDVRFKMASYKYNTYSSTHCHSLAPQDQQKNASLRCDRLPQLEHDIRGSIIGSSSNAPPPLSILDRSVFFIIFFCLRSAWKSNNASMSSAACAGMTATPARMDPMTTSLP